MTHAIEAPPYGSGTLADVLPSTASLWGVQGFRDTLDLVGRDPGRSGGPPEAVTVLLIDGMGWWPWHGMIERTPTLAAMGRSRLSTTVPSTTPTALASLGTGVPPGAHGIVGASFRVPEDDLMLHPLSWTDTPHPVATQPEPTVFERVAAEGVPVVSIGPSAYAASGLTRAVLRGGDYSGSDGTDAIVDAIGRHGRGLAYAYVPDLDRTGHVYGVDSREWREGMHAIDELVARVIDAIGDDHLLVVTADHGMVDCPPSAHVRVEDLPGFDGVATVAGEPRLRHVYLRPGRLAHVRQAWQEELAGRAIVAERDEAIALGLFGETEEHYAERIGDLVLLAQGDTLLVSDADPLISGLLGQHGSVTEAEMDIPLLLARGSGRG